MTTDLATTTADPSSIAVQHEEAGVAALLHVLGTGDLSKLSDRERAGHYARLCRSLGLNELSRPFDWIEFYDPETKGKKLQFYPNQSCAAQLRRQHQISIRVVRREVVGELFCVEVEGRTPNGRVGVANKYVPLTDSQGNKLRGQRLANAYMKAETGAQRRLTLSMVGLSSPPDIDEAKGARFITVDGTGRILENPTPEQKALAADPRMARVLGEPVFEDAGDDFLQDDGAVSQAARPDELERPQRQAERAMLRPTKEQVDGWQRAWFASVKGTSLDTDDARHRFVDTWTRDELEWPEGKRTDSLRTMFARMTDGEASDVLAHIRAVCDDERRAMLEDAHAALASSPTVQRRHDDERVHDAVRLTGGPADDEDQAAF